MIRAMPMSTGGYCKAVPNRLPVNAAITPRIEYVTAIPMT